MEPLGIATSIFAVCQAGDRALALLSRIRRAYHASEEINALAKDIQRLRSVLDVAEIFALSQPSGGDAIFRTILDDCDSIVRELECLLAECLKAPRKLKAFATKHFVRMHWMKRKTIADTLRQQLRDAVSCLELYVQVVTAQKIYRNGHQHHSSEFYCALECTDQLRLISTDSGLHRLHPDGSQVLDTVATEFEVANSSGCFQPHEAKVCFTVTSSGTENDDPSLADSSRPRACTQRCRCQCHRRSVRLIRLAHGTLGSLFISRSGSLSQPGMCTRIGCASRSVPSFSVLYFVPRWLSLTSIFLTLSNPGRPQISLSFPRVLPPDSEFFECIRTGQCGRVKELLTLGSAHVADIVSPYGISALHLAMIYGQVGVSRLLIAADASQIPSHWSWVRSDVWEYFARYSLLQSSMSSHAVLQDVVRHLTPDSGTNRPEIDAEIIRLEGENLSRMHKVVLRLSSETYESVARESQGLLNEVDSYNRTPLYWAARTGNEEAVRTLLLYGADTEICDHNGDTPLHVAAGYGFLECARLLASSGARLESMDRLGGTPLHHACSNGHVGIIESLLDFGAELAATNCLGETAIFYASHARQVGAVKCLVERGTSLKHIDEWGYTPVLDMVMTDSHEALAFLLSQGSDMNTRLFDGKTFWHIAAQHSDLRTIKILLNADLRGLDPEAVDNAGFRPAEYLSQRKDKAEVSDPFRALMLRGGESCSRQITNRQPETAGGPAVDLDGEESLVESFNDAVEFQNLDWGQGSRGLKSQICCE